MFSPSDFVVLPAPPGYALFRLEHLDAGTDLIPVWMREFKSWEAAARMGRSCAMRDGVRAWARRDESESLYIELGMALHPETPWSGAWRPFAREWIDTQVPSVPGVYVLGPGRPVFVGETDDLRSRLLHHALEPMHCLRSISPLLFSFAQSEPAADRQFLLSQLVTAWSPPCNQTR